MVHAFHKIASGNAFFKIPWTNAKYSTECSHKKVQRRYLWSVVFFAFPKLRLWNALFSHLISVDGFSKYLHFKLGAWPGVWPPKLDLDIEIRRRIFWVFQVDFLWLAAHVSFSKYAVHSALVGSSDAGRLLLQRISVFLHSRHNVVFMGRIWPTHYQFSNVRGNRQQSSRYFPKRRMFSGDCWFNNRRDGWSNDHFHEIGR